MEGQAARKAANFKSFGTILSTGSSMFSNYGGGGFGSFGGAQAAFSQTSVGASGFGSGLAYGQRDLGQYL